jgi:hypothetical protein
MQRFKNILVIVDESTENRAVVEWAVTLVQRKQSRLTVVNTVRAMPCQSPRPITPESPVDTQGQVLDIELELGRRYCFRYVVDGKEGFNDWHLTGDLSCIERAEMDKVLVSKWEQENDGKKQSHQLLYEA